LIGTVVLVLLWLALGLMERRGQHFGGMIARALRKPLLLGLSASLYLGWLGRQIADNVKWRPDVLSDGSRWTTRKICRWPSAF
jgi:MscS family membrane protein